MWGGGNELSRFSRNFPSRLTLPLVTLLVAGTYVSVYLLYTITYLVQ